MNLEISETEKASIQPLLDYQYQTAFFWGKKRNEIIGTKNIDYTSLEKLDRMSDNFSKVVEALLSKFGNFQEVFYFLKWYFRNRTSLIKIPFNKLLELVGICVLDKETSQLELDLYEEFLNKFYQDISIINDEKGIIDTADGVLGDIYNINARYLPISYGAINKVYEVTDRATEVIRPSISDMIKLIQCLSTGGTMYMYCCPDYARIQREDGTFEYKMDQLGEGIGLTAEKGMPEISSIIQHLALSALEPINIEVGIADFEATEANVQMVGLSNIDEFEVKLGNSLVSMYKELIAQLGTDFTVEVISENVNDSVGGCTAEVSFKGRVISYISFSRITDKYHGVYQNYNSKTLNYEGKQTFDSLVEDERLALKERAIKDSHFQRKLDLLIKLRISLMIKWTDINDPNVPEQIKKYYVMFKEIEDSKFENIVEVLEKNGFQFKFTDDKKTIDTFTINEREEILRIILIKELFSGSREIQEVLNYLRIKIAMQGAEYAVMHKLMSYDQNSIHIVADAMNMWQIFGQESIDILGIKGGYTGAKSILEA